MLNQCKSIRPLISEFVDGSLSNEKAWRVQLHMSVCRDCADFAEGIDKTVALLKSAPVASISPEFDSSLRRRLAAAEQERETAFRRSWVSSILFDLRVRASMISNAARIRFAVTAPVAVAAATLTFMAIVGPSATQSPTHVPTASTPAAVESADFETACMTTHRAYVAGLPFADPAAQALFQRSDSEEARRLDTSHGPGSL